MQQDHQRAVAAAVMVALRALGFHHMEADAVRVDLQVPPRSVYAHNRRIGTGVHDAVATSPKDRW